MCSWLRLANVDETGMTTLFYVVSVVLIFAGCIAYQVRFKDADQAAHLHALKLLRFHNNAGSSPNTGVPVVEIAAIPTPQATQQHAVCYIIAPYY